MSTLSSSKSPRVGNSGSASPAQSAWGTDASSTQQPRSYKPYIGRVLKPTLVATDDDVVCISIYRICMNMYWMIKAINDNNNDNIIIIIISCCCSCFVNISLAELYICKLLITSSFMCNASSLPCCIFSLRRRKAFFLRFPLPREKLLFSRSHSLSMTIPKL